MLYYLTYTTKLLIKLCRKLARCSWVWKKTFLSFSGQARAGYCDTGQIDKEIICPDFMECSRECGTKLHRSLGETHSSGINLSLENVAIHCFGHLRSKRELHVLTDWHILMWKRNFFDKVKWCPSYEVEDYRFICVRVRSGGRWEGSGVSAALEDLVQVSAPTQLLVFCSHSPRGWCSSGP